MKPIWIFTDAVVSLQHEAHGDNPVSPEIEEAIRFVQGKMAMVDTDHGRRQA
jgi:hypothetical protein